MKGHIFIAVSLASFYLTQNITAGGENHFPVVSPFWHLLNCDCDPLHQTLALLSIRRVSSKQH